MVGNGRLPVSRLEHVGHAGKDYCARKAIRKGTRGDGSIGSASVSGFSKLEQPASRIEREASRESRVKGSTGSFGARARGKEKKSAKKRVIRWSWDRLERARIRKGGRNFKGKRVVVGFDW